MDIFYVQIFVYIFFAAVIFLFLRHFARKGEKILVEQKRRIEAAPKARAKVVAFGKSRTLKQNGTILVKLRFEVFPLDLRPSFQASTVWEIEPAAMSEIQPGKMLSVKFDERETTHIYPLDARAKFSRFYHSNLLEEKSSIDVAARI